MEASTRHMLEPPLVPGYVTMVVSSSPGWCREPQVALCRASYLVVRGGGLMARSPNPAHIGDEPQR